eukprot:6491331-Amphidinium_carterae.1
MVGTRLMKDIPWMSAESSSVFWLKGFIGECESLSLRLCHEHPEVMPLLYKGPLDAQVRYADTSKGWREAS